jgi:hypothetical protein
MVQNEVRGLIGGVEFPLAGPPFALTQYVRTTGEQETYCSYQQR